MGQALYRALGSSDEPVIMGVALVVSVAVVIMNLAADIAYCVIDPRVRLRTGRRLRVPELVRRRRGNARAELTEPIT